MPPAAPLPRQGHSRRAQAPPLHPPRADFWRHQGPPTGPLRSGANSWLYVPLLHAAAGDLSPAAVASWRSSLPARAWWEAARAHLVASAPLPAQALQEALQHHDGQGAAAAAASISRAAARSYCPHRLGLSCAGRPQRLPCSGCAGGSAAALRRSTFCGRT